MQPVKAPILLAAALVLAAQCVAAAEGVPKPRLRPAPVAASEKPEPPIPKQRPSAASAAPAVIIPVPQLRPSPQVPETRERDGNEDAGPGVATGWPAEVITAGRAQCTSLLAGHDVDYVPVDPIGDQGSCGAPAPIEVTAVAGVKLVPPAIQTCSMAAALAAWLAEDVQPAAKKRLGTAVTEVRTATSYACRRRNNGASGKMSEHSKANALDISGFTFAQKAGVTVGGKDNWGEALLGAIGLSKNGSFLEDIRKGACTHFTTVLGPGSDPFHGDHFHVDVLQRKGDYRICQ